ncbi:hypothetical protein ACFZAM_31725 [Streptomyces sp. NPDC008079]|uniref:hypothetical protein n=1 Tax=Streptomyces sp. NPDC008079 TaxID=3364806 RepID=UPI0036E65A4C
MGGEPDETGQGRLLSSRRPVFLRRWFIAAVTLALGLVLGFAVSSHKAPPAPSAAHNRPPSSRTAATVVVQGDGEYWVGQDIPPGIYLSQDNSRTRGCRWSRSVDASGQDSSILSSAAPAGSSYVELEPGNFFRTSRCRPWALQPPPPGGQPPFLTPPPPGQPPPMPRTPGLLVR